MNRKLRNRLFTLHTWLGLHFSIFFFFLFLTGTLLVVGIELESIGRPAVWTTAAKAENTASFGTIYEGIKEAYPESQIRTIVKRPSPWLADQTYGRAGWGEQVIFWTDPKTGAVVDVTGVFGFRELVRELHVALMTGHRIAFLAICATSVVLLYQIVSGLITYRRFWKGFFRWPRSSGGFRSWTGGAHRLTAVWATPLLIISAVTAFYFLLGDLGLDGTTPTAQPAAARDSRLPAGFSPAILDQAEARARAALPGFEPQTLTLPGRRVESFTFNGYFPGISDIRGYSTVVVDPKTFEILGAFTPNDSTSFARWRPMVDKLHYGFWGGVFSMVLWFVLGLAATGVACTGALIFAARLVPDAAQYGPLRRIWRGLGIYRWAYLLLLLGILSAGYLRFGPDSYRTARVFPADAAGSVARLLLSEPLRRDTPIDVELRIGEPDIRAARIAINGDSPQTIDLSAEDGAAWARFNLNPADAANEVIAHLKNPDGSERAVTFRLGRLIW